MAKTSLSLSHEHSWKGVPTDTASHWDIRASMVRWLLYPWLVS
jgi:hypothetical protein